MRKGLKAAVLACLSIAPLFAGALVLEVGSPKGDAEALSKNAVLVTRMTACMSPEKTTVTATAEGMVKGVRRTIPLTLTKLSANWTWSVAREWPAEGNWVVKVVATNPDYKDYAPSFLVPVRSDGLSFSAVKRVTHVPTAAEIESVLTQNSI